jgi:polysaccharide export outer membrane protein
MISPHMMSRKDRLAAGVMAMAMVMATAFVPALPAMAQSAALNASQPAYVLGPGDGIQIIIYGQAEAGVTTRVKADGTIVMPFIGIVKAGGETNLSLAKVVADRMVAGGYLKDPLVNVEVTEYASKTVNVAGRVGTPAIVPLDKPYTALEVLLKSGWVRDNGANYVYLNRPGQPEKRLEVEAMVRGDVANNPQLNPGDTVYVPDADSFFVYGAIASTGRYAILPGMTVRQAITLAGGVTASGSINKVSLLRGDGREVDADLSQKVEKNDVLVVKERLF